jgi:hypothetical protein
VEIDRAIHHGDASRAVGERFGLTKPTVTGHRRSGHHLLQTPRQRNTGTPHTAATLLRRIADSRGDHEAMLDLRLAASTLPHGERRRLIEELRRRAGIGVGAKPVEEAA